MTQLAEDTKANDSLSPGVILHAPAIDGQPQRLAITAMLTKTNAMDIPEAVFAVVPRHAAQTSAGRLFSDHCLERLVTVPEDGEQRLLAPGHGAFIAVKIAPGVPVEGPDLDIMDLPATLNDQVGMGSVEGQIVAFRDNVSVLQGFAERSAWMVRYDLPDGSSHPVVGQPCIVHGHLAGAIFGVSRSTQTAAVAPIASIHERFASLGLEPAGELTFMKLARASGQTTKFEMPSIQISIVQALVEEPGQPSGRRHVRGGKIKSMAAGLFSYFGARRLEPQDADVYFDYSTFGQVAEAGPHTVSFAAIQAERARQGEGTGN